MIVLHATMHHPVTTGFGCVLGFISFFVGGGGRGGGVGCNSESRTFAVFILSKYLYVFRVVILN
jgi:hypothetical protein